MIPVAFEYERAGTLAEAVELLGRNPEAKLLAGGHSLVPLLKLRLAQPPLLVDLGPARELAYVRVEGEELAIGAMTRHHDVHTDEVVRRECRLLSETAGTVGDPQVRHRGTIGGSVAHGDAASDLPVALLALEATIVVQGTAGKRAIPARDFFRGFLDTALEPGEVLAEIRVPRMVADAGCSYLKFTRRALDWATVGVAVIGRVEAGQVRMARIALTNMGPAPVRASAAEERLLGAAANVAELRAAAAEVAGGTSPPTDTNGSAEYRRHLATVLAARALEAALLPAGPAPSLVD